MSRLELIRLPSIQKVFKGSLANIAYIFLQSLLFIVLTPKLLKTLGEDLYGVFTILLSVVVFAGYANFGSVAAVTKYTAQYLVSDNLREKLFASISFNYIFTFLISLFISVICWLLRHWIATTIQTNFDIKEMSTAIGLVAISLTPNYVAQISRGVLLGLLQNQLVGVILLIHDIALWIGVLFLGSISNNPIHLGQWILIINIAKFVITTMLVFWKMRDYHLRIAWMPKLNYELLRYTFGDWFGLLGVALFTVGVKILVGMVLGATEAGVYGVATGIAIRVSMIATYFSQPLAPFASSNQQRDKIFEIKKAFQYVTKLNSVVVSFLVISLVMWLDIILSFWISPEFAQLYAQHFRVIIIGYGLYALAAPTMSIFEGLGWVTARSLFLFGSGLFLFISLWYLSKKLGLLGAMYANYIISLVLLLNIILVQKLKIRVDKIVLNIAIPLFLLIGAGFIPLSGLSFYMYRGLINIAVAIILFYIILCDGEIKRIVKYFRVNN